MGNSKTDLAAINIRSTKKTSTCYYFEGVGASSDPRMTEASQLKKGTSNRYPASNNILENATRNPSDASCNLTVSWGPDEWQVTFCVRVCHCYPSCLLSGYNLRKQASGKCDTFCCHAWRINLILLQSKLWLRDQVRLGASKTTGFSMPFWESRSDDKMAVKEANPK